MKYIASCSCGKDSLAMVLKLIESNAPLDEVVFYDTGMEYECTYHNWDKLCSILDSKGITHTVLKPDLPFEYKAFEKPVKYRKKEGYHYGYSWCGGGCRWGTNDKLKALNHYCGEGDCIVYVGIAADEKKRLCREYESYKCFPLLEFGMTEADCLQYCRSHGFDWKEPNCNNIDLYTILDRVTCWCCANKNLKELRNMYTYMPYYWEKLREFQSKTERPMKKYCKGGKRYGSVFELEEIFKNEK